MKKCMMRACICVCLCLPALAARDAIAIGDAHDRNMKGPRRSPTGLLPILHQQCCHTNAAYD